MFLDEVNKAIEIFDKKYPHARAIFMFDNAPSHCKYPADGLNVDRINVGPGGKQAILNFLLGKLHLTPVDDGNS